VPADVVKENLRILVVEDDAAYARLVADNLRQKESSPAITTVSRINDAISRLQATSYDAILLDLNLPDSDGLDSFTRLAAFARNTPVVILTSMDSEANAAAALREGAEEYLVKHAVDSAPLSKTIRHAVERHAYREALRATEARYRSVVEGSVQGILIHVDGVIRFANQALADLTGFDRAEQLVGRSIWPFISPEDRPMVEQYAQARAEGRPAPTRYDLRIIRRDGAVRWVDCIVSIIEWGNELSVMGALVDVTEQKVAEANLRASEERFRLLADNIKEAFIIVEVPSGKTLYLSRMWEEIWGWDIEEAYAHPLLWLDSIDGEDRPLVARSFRALQHGEAATDVFRVHRPDRSVRWVRARMFPVRDESGRVYRLVGLAEDITQVRHTEEQLRQAQRMEAVGRLAGGVAHDFNNLLTVIDGFTELVAEDLGPSHRSRKDLDQIRTAARSAASLTRQLLAFSRRQILQPQILDLNQVLRHVERLLGRVIGEDVTLVMKLSEPLARTSADPGQIEQVIMNLAVNARDAMPSGGRLTIETANVELDAEYVARHQDASAGKHVMIAVSDTGIGMDEATQRRLFEPFFTTKPAGRGTGLGLATVYGIVKQSQGSIWVYSELEKGTTFKIYLPVADGAAPALPPPSEVLVLDGTETVLVVEDQREVRGLIDKTLRRHGYVVLVASNGAEAAAIAREHMGTIHVLLTDVVLPGTGGREIARKLIAEREQLRVVYMSGYTDDAIVHHGVLDPGLAFIQKPFTGETLLRKIREVLDAAVPPPW
jgi:two-component system cell cycle sensor histidine kinase/response regulator CckA